jgi:ABC-2 type transport system ATP-binding protein
MDEKIEIKNLSKNYGQKQALKNINLTIEKGMFGLLGRNGAGKTTLMRILAAILCKTEGEVTVYGTPIEKAKKIRSITGYLPQEFSFYPNLTVYEALDYLGVLSGMKKSERAERIPNLLKMVNLNGKKNTKIKALSGGMKRRLGIAQAILHQPKVLIVDEPTAGLDPEERVRFRKLLCDIAEDRIVILSTHIVEDIEKTCKNIAVLRDGEVIYNGTIDRFVEDEKGLEDAYMKKIRGEE